MQTPPHPYQQQPQNQQQPWHAMLAQHAEMLPDLQKLRQELEGPKPLRVLAGIAGLVLAITCALGLINIFSLITHPAKFVLEIYEMLFGCLIVAVELKNTMKHGHQLSDFIYKWFPFLGVIGGKGVFYIFVGSLGLGFGWMNLLVFLPALFVLLMGLIYTAIHLGKFKQLEQKYDQTLYMTVSPGPSTGMPYTAQTPPSYQAYPAAAAQYN